VPFCPRCGSEYEAGVERCCDCNEVLVAHMPPENSDAAGRHGDFMNGDEIHGGEQEIPDRLIQIAVFNYPIEAHLCKTRLESEGIECFIAHEHFGNVHLFPDESGAVRLQVRESDAAGAMQILEQEPPVDTESAGNTGKEDMYGPQCPRCGSPDVSSRKRSPALVLLSIPLLGIPLLFVKTKWDCRGCWHTWKAYPSPGIQR
jgi:hypothetical protein